MTKVFNAKRMRRLRERQRRIENRAAEDAARRVKEQRSYAPGDSRKNVRLKLDALGLPIRRRMVARLAQEGAMSLSKLAEPFNITLPSALAQLHILERAGIVTSLKRGRTRLCVHNPHALKELARLLDSGDTVRSLS